MGVRYHEAANAEDVIRQLAAPQVLAAAEEIANRIPDNVPVSSGVARRQYRHLHASKQPDGSARITGLPFLWHWLEFGTRWNPPYAPIRRTVERLGLGWRAG